jgi:hypothetical protein
MPPPGSDGQFAKSSSDQQSDEEFFRTATGWKPSKTAALFFIDRKYSRRSDTMLVHDQSLTASA